MNRPFSEEIAAALREALDEEEIRYVYDGETGTFRFGLTLKGPIRSVLYTVLVNDDSIVLHVTPPIAPDREDPDQIRAMAEFVCRANWGFKYGRFDLNPDDGTLRFQIYVDCEDGMASREVIHKAVNIPLFVFDQYGYGITQLLYHGTSPAEAIKKSEERIRRSREAIRKKELMRSILEMFRQAPGVTLAEELEGADGDPAGTD